MSYKLPPLSPYKEWCILANLEDFTVSCVRPLSQVVRVCTNNYSWMKRKHLHWYTVSTFVVAFGDCCDEVLQKYSDLYTIDRLVEMNERIKS